MNRINQGFEACLFHPDLGNEVVNGTLLLDRWKVRFQSDAHSREILMEQLEVELADDGQRIYFRDAGDPELQIFTLNQAVLKHPAFQSREIRSQVAPVLQRRDLSQRLRMLAYFCVGAVIVTWLGSLIVGGMVRTVAKRVPMEWEENFGQEQMEELKGEMDLLDDTNRVARLAALADPLMAALPEGRQHLRFYIAEMEEPNAFALPGGHVVVTTGLIEMVEQPEELLGVIAHEIAHVTERHAIRGVVSSAGPFVVLGVFFNGRGGVVELLAAGSAFVVAQGFSQEMETEADDVGWKYLVNAGIDPRGMISTFQKFEAYERLSGGFDFLPQAFSSHPALDKRIARLEKKSRKLTGEFRSVEEPEGKWQKP